MDGDGRVAELLVAGMVEVEDGMVDLKTDFEGKREEGWSSCYHVED